MPGCSGTDGSASDYCIDPNAFHIPAGGNGSNDSESYVPGKLNVQKLGLLLSEGLDARLIATTGELVRYANGQSSSTVFHGRPDGK